MSMKFGLLIEEGKKNSNRHIENRSSPYFFPNAVWTSASGGFRIVSDTLVMQRTTETEFF